MLTVGVISSRNDSEIFDVLKLLYKGDKKSKFLERNAAGISSAFKDFTNCSRLFLLTNPLKEIDFFDFDIIVMQASKDLPDPVVSGQIKNILLKANKSATLILSSDDPDSIKTASEFKGYVVSCGLNSRATVTFSSISDDGFVMCIQRNIQTPDGRNIELQEIPVKTSLSNKNIQNVLIAQIVKLISG